MQGIAAILGVLLTALVVFGVVQNRDGSNAPSTAATPLGGSQARVTLELVTTGPNEVQGSGSYAGLDPRSQAVVFMGRPAGTADADWIGVPATLARQSELGGREVGRWEATRPGVPAGRWQWFALIAPAAAGATDVYEDLRRNGPDSEFVLARSEPHDTE